MSSSTSVAAVPHQSGFALSASRTVLNGGVGRMAQLARSNLRNTFPDLDGLAEGERGPVSSLSVLETP